MKNAEKKRLNTLQGDTVKNKGENNTNIFNSTCNKCMQVAAVVMYFS